MSATYARRVPAWILLPLAALPFAYFGGCCDDDCRVANASRALLETPKSDAPLAAKGFTTGPQVARPAVVTEPAGASRRVYLDATQSLRGFTGCDTASTRFDQVLQGTVRTLRLSHVTLFGLPPRFETGAPAFRDVEYTRELRCSSRFDRVSNPDSVLYDSIAHDARTHFSVYVTDGVQSADSGGQVSASVNQLARWIDSGRPIGVMLFRSEYEDSIWSEHVRRFLPPRPLQRKPFYLFLLSHTEQVLDYWLKQLQSVLYPEQTLRIAPGSVACAFQAGVPYFEQRDDLRWTFVHPRIWAPINDQGARRSIRLGALRCSVDRYYPLLTVEPEIRSTVQPWLGNAFGPRAAPTHVRFIPVPIPAPARGSREWAIAAESAAPLSSLYNFFSLSIRPVLRDLNPDWTGVSTSNDAEPEGFERTYGLNVLLRVLVEADLARRDMAVPYHFTVREVN